MMMMISDFTFARSSAPNCHCLCICLWLSDGVICSTQDDIQALITLITYSRGGFIFGLSTIVAQKSTRVARARARATKRLRRKLESSTSISHSSNRILQALQDHHHSVREKMSECGRKLRWLIQAWARRNLSSVQVGSNPEWFILFNLNKKKKKRKHNSKELDAAFNLDALRRAILLCMNGSLLIQRNGSALWVLEQARNVASSAQLSSAGGRAGQLVHTSSVMFLYFTYF